MNFDVYFRASSYAMIVSAVLALIVAGRMSTTLIILFGGLMVAAWLVEGRRWQLSERTGLVVLVLALPLFYLDWKYQTVVGYLDTQGRNHGAVTALVHLTLFLSAVKLWQVKADRDWLFLYLISFFEVLLAAGLSLTPLFVGVLALYLFWALLTIVCFEMRKARRAFPQGEAHLLVTRSDAGLKSLARLRARGRGRLLRRLPVAACCLLVLTFALALPIFFITPRFGENALAMAGGLATNYVGFSEQMTLGDFGRLQQNDQIVMRVRVEGPSAGRNRNLRWRGVALDKFDGRRWSRSSGESLLVYPGERDFFRLGTTENLNRLTMQTFFLEPMDTPVLFVAPRAVGLQGASLSVVRRDAEGALSARPHIAERLSYRVYSDTFEPPVEELRRDIAPYTRAHERYLEFPATLDTGIASLAWHVVTDSGARTRYDAARAIEEYLSSHYDYSLEMRAGGADPLSDFLFRVKAGHCEYFSSAMTMMLRSQGIAARVVNGFQTGEYNDAAGAYTVRQSDAHSWVEVYFPQTGSWVTFDPTPAAGQNIGAQRAGFGEGLGKYTDALELFWIQYVVAYDRQEQRSLANTVRQRLGSSIETAAQSAESLSRKLQGWPLFSSVASVAAAQPMLAGALAFGLLLLSAGALLLLVRLMRRKGWLRRRRTHQGDGLRRSAVAFYERMTAALAAHGIVRAPDQTPLEFAAASGMPEALTITRAYHRVRYGTRELTSEEATEIENCLKRIEERHQ